MADKPEKETDAAEPAAAAGWRLGRAAQPETPRDPADRDDQRQHKGERQGEPEIVLVVYGRHVGWIWIRVGACDRRPSRPAAPSPPGAAEGRRVGG